MARNIVMPSLSPTMEEGTLARWMVAVGDRFTAGDVLAEIETDKATMEIEAEADGVIVSLEVAAPADGVKVGTVIATASSDADVDARQNAGMRNEHNSSAYLNSIGKDDSFDVLMPAISSDAESGTLARWMVAVGDAISVGDVLAEIETDKATVEVEAEDSGVVLSLEVAAGTDDVAVGSVIATMSRVTSGSAEIAQSEASTSSDAAPRSAEGRTNMVEAAAEESPSSSIGRLEPDPVEVDASETTGGTSEALAGSTGAAPPFERVALTAMRRTIARRLTEAKQQIPHIYLSVDVKVDQLLDVRSDMNLALEARGVRLSVNDFLIKALAIALETVPECNVQFAEQDLLKFSRVDVSVAVSVPGGLVTPVIIDAGRRSVSAISTQMKELAERAREGRLAPHEYQGGSASISNMGMFGIKQFQAIINPPQALILAVGASEARPAITDGAVGIATFLNVTGSFDHRVIDGADGARFLSAFKQLVEDPLSLLA